MGLFNFSSLKDTILGVKNRISELDKEISSFETQRNALVSLPLPYDDFVEFALTRYDYLANDYGAQLTRELLNPDSSMRSFYMTQRTGHETLEDFNAVFSGKSPIPFERPYNHHGHSFPMTEPAFFYIFKDDIKAGVRRILDETVKPKWPKDVGLPRAERIPQIEKIEKKLAALIGEREQIQSELSNAVSHGS